MGGGGGAAPPQAGVGRGGVGGTKNARADMQTTPQTCLHPGPNARRHKISHSREPLSSTVVGAFVTEVVANVSATAADPLPQFLATKFLERSWSREREIERVLCVFIYSGSP